MRRARHTRGFTLIELLVAMSIVALLAAVAIPAYTQYVDRSKRAEGRAALQRGLQAMERYYTANQRYVEFSPASPAAGMADFSGDNPDTSHYRLSAVACPGRSLTQCVELRAEPSGVHGSGSGFRDPRCGTLTLTTTGTRGLINATDSTETCWRR
ncbi:MAG: type IV pilin protein [Burkholderiaceae bacterium]